jgi:hypothetical protein
VFGSMAVVDIRGCVRFKLGVRNPLNCRRTLVERDLKKVEGCRA